MEPLIYVLLINDPCSRLGAKKLSKVFKDIRMSVLRKNGQENAKKPITYSRSVVFKIELL